MAVGKHSDRGAALNDHKERGAARSEQNPQLNPARDAKLNTPAKGQTGGAHGKNDMANRHETTAGGNGVSQGPG